jgi:hypothetical protein
VLAVGRQLLEVARVLAEVVAEVEAPEGPARVFEIYKDDVGRAAVLLSLLYSKIHLVS